MDIEAMRCWNKQAIEGKAGKEISDCTRENNSTLELGKFLYSRTRKHIFAWLIETWNDFQSETLEIFLAN